MQQIFQNKSMVQKIQRLYYSKIDTKIWKSNILISNLNL